MRLNLHILREDLKEYVICEHLPEKAWELCLRYPVLCDRLPDNPKPDLLYLCPAPSPNDSSSFLADKVCYACFIGTPSGEWFEGNCYFLGIKTEMNAKDFLNTLSSVFSEYQEWEASLQEVIDQRLPLDELAARSVKFVNNPVFAQDAGFSTFFFYRPEVKNETDAYKEYKKNYPILEDQYLDPDTINEMITDTAYIGASASVEPALFKGKANNFRDLYYNVRIDGIYAARIFIDEVITPLTGKDYAVIKVLGGFIKKALENQVYHYTRKYESEEILSELLSHHLLPETRIQGLLDSRQWNMNDSYLCAVIKSKAEDQENRALHSIEYHITGNFKQKVSVVFNNAIVVIFNLSAMNMDQDRVESALLPLMRDNFLSCALSLVYHDFKDLYYYYRQTLMTEMIGMKKDPTKWFFRIADYQMDYIIEKCADHSVYGTMIPEALSLLINYDRTHNTDYAHLLRIYLNNDRSIIETARHAYIHRNTCLYRIKRIRQLLPMDLDIPENRTLLQVAFIALDHNKMR